MHQNPQLEEILIQDIIINYDFQMRIHMDTSTVRRYKAKYKNENEADETNDNPHQANPMPPVTIARVNGVLFLVDGFHRIAALKDLKIAFTVASVIDCSMKEAYWFAIQANTTHGLHLSNKERRLIFRQYIHKGFNKDVTWYKGIKVERYKTYRQIAADLGGTNPHTTISTWMKKDFPRIYKAMSNKEDTTKYQGGLMNEPPTTQDMLWEKLTELKAFIEQIQKGECDIEFKSGLDVISATLDQMFQKDF